MKNLFTYMFKDNQIIKKSAILFGFLFISNLSMLLWNYYDLGSSKEVSPLWLTGALICSLIAIIPCGYVASCIRALNVQEKDFSLPYINVKRDFILGLKLFVNIILFIICCFIPVVLAVVTTASLLEHTGHLTLALALTLACICVLFAFIFIYFMALNAIFVKTEWLTSFFRFKRATNLIKQDKKRYFTGVGLFIVLAFLNGFLSSICEEIASSLTLVFVCSVAISLIGIYWTYAYAYLISKFVKIESID